MNALPTMQYVNLGQCGLKVSKVILGAMSYGSSDWAGWVQNEDEALPLLKAAFDRGINTWDTADIYSNGLSERIIGKAIKKYEIPRERLVILSKCYFGFEDTEDTPLPKREPGKPSAFRQDPHAFVNRQGGSRKYIMAAVDASIKRLGTYIDVLQIHRLDHSTPMEETLKALHDIVESGKARYIGASSMAAWEFQMMQNIAEKRGWTKFISMQNYYNLIYREEEREMIPYCKNTGVGLIPWSPIARGVLARPFSDRSTIREQTDYYLMTLVRQKESESDRAIVDKVEELAKARGVSMAVVAMSYVLQKGMMPIVGLSSVKRIDEAVLAASFKLEPDEIRALEEPYIPRPVFPGW
ncbi:versiconal hemiacetal acetate reductase [Terfezia claveryi]|nr:versiconal hemiacetal acetate reductase [Terfezia claveryi]